MKNYIYKFTEEEVYFLLLLFYNMAEDKNVKQHENGYLLTKQILCKLVEPIIF